MKLTDALLGEHGAFYMLFDQIEEIAATENAMAQWRGATTVLEAMVNSHAVLEEELLFSALEPHLGKEAGPLALMMLSTRRWNACWRTYRMTRNRSSHVWAGIRRQAVKSRKVVDH
ncbi:MAG: hypothetical protein HY659_04510 [Rhizobiales bacterium]|nr:hypothetical protein [Hyphomicrobiales bacterium]